MIQVVSRVLCMLRKCVFISALVILVMPVETGFAQQRQYTTNLNGWYMYVGDHKFSNHWGVHLEAQFRRNEVITNPQQLLLRTGLNFHFNPQVFVTLGYCFVETYPYGEFPVKSTFPEHRLWQQLQFKNTHGSLEWISRFRMEERFSNLPVLTTDTTYQPGDAVYTNRFRLLNRFSVPFNGKIIEDKSFYISVYDEIFIGFGKNVGLNLIDQNRAYMAIGYKIPGVGRLEIGYLNQLVVKSDGIKIENNHTLQLGLSSVISFKKEG
ncbi:MAG: DUF2490 domain-containing protein [Flavobacteriales bacterium]